jgi:hypothetical protein
MDFPWAVGGDAKRCLEHRELRNRAFHRREVTRRNTLEVTQNRITTASQQVVEVGLVDLFL